MQADAQALRAAVLLDELDFPGFGVHDPRTGHIVVEMRTPHGASLLKYSCSPRVLCLPTIQLNARRLAQQQVMSAVTLCICHTFVAVVVNAVKGQNVGEKDGAILSRVLHNRPCSYTLCMVFIGTAYIAHQLAQIWPFAAVLSCMLSIRLSKHATS